MNFKKIILLALFASAASLAQAQAKIGFVNVERLMKESDMAKAAGQTLQTEFASRDKRLQDQGEELRKKGERLQNERLTMAPAEQTRLQNELQTLDFNFQRDRRNLEEEIAARRNQLQSALLDKANREMVRIAEAEKLDAVFSEAPWFNPKLDLTERILRVLK